MGANYFFDDCSNIQSKSKASLWVKRTIHVQEQTGRSPLFSFSFWWREVRGAGRGEKNGGPIVR